MLLESTPRGARRVAVRRTAPVVEETKSTYLYLKAACANDLASLRTSLKEAVYHYNLRLDAKIAKVAGLLEDEETLPGRDELMHHTKTLQKARKLLADLDLKEEKGRRKDLHAIETAASRLDDLMSDW